MYQCVKAANLSAILALVLAGSAFGQSTTSDPMGINAIEDPTLQTQRGSLQRGTNGDLGHPYGWNSRVIYRDWLGNELQPAIAPATSDDDIE